jgi:signal peptide peptidase SppA
MRHLLTEQIWSIRQDVLQAALDAYESDAVEHAAARVPRTSGSIAIIPIHGMITQRAGPLGDVFGGTSLESFTRAFRRAVNTSRVRGIVLDIDSPGGTTPGVETAANEIFAARGSKPILAVANSQMASAAYWLGSQADEVIAAPGSTVGSVGVFRLHLDESGLMEDAGIRPTFIAHPERKVEGNPFEPLSTEAISHQREQVEETYAVFADAVARGRGMPSDAVAERTGQGRAFSAKQAQSRGMARIGPDRGRAGRRVEPRGGVRVPDRNQTAASEARRAA